LVPDTTEGAERMEISFQRLDRLANRRRSRKPDTVLRLSKVVGTTPGKLDGVVRSDSAGAEVVSVGPTTPFPPGAGVTARDSAGVRVVQLPATAAVPTRSLLVDVGGHGEGPGEFSPHGGEAQGLGRVGKLPTPRNGRFPTEGWGRGR